MNKDLPSVAEGIYLDVVTAWNNDEIIEQEEIEELVRELIIDATYTISDDIDEEDTINDTLLELVLDLISGDPHLSVREDFDVDED